VALLLGGLMAVGVVVLGGKIIITVLTPKLSVMAEDEHGTVLKSAFENGEVRVRDEVVGHVRDKTFTPVPRVQLGSGGADASIATPVLCALPSGEAIRLRFGSGRSTSQASSRRSAGETPQPEIPLTRR
jgi:hypothetical protein